MNLGLVEYEAELLAQQTTTECLSCNKTLTGRSDKKFCDDNCRVTYHNTLKSERNNTMRNINNVLYKNRRIMESLVPVGCKMAKVTKGKLLSKGFDFKYYTHTQLNKKFNVYYYCYDYGYLPLEKDCFLIVASNQ